ncbi:MAG: glycoside hydrolase family 88 protein [Planctomycetota bacterium]|jgi:rhamnogalacturonyl hydrolase YesR
MTTRSLIRLCVLSVLVGQIAVDASAADNDVPLPDGISRVPIGVLLDNRQVFANVSLSFQQPTSTGSKILLVVDEARAGNEFAQKVADSWARFVRDRKQEETLDFGLIRIPDDGEPAVFPPKGTSYKGPQPAAQYIWRWIGMAAPDVVLELRPGTSEKISSGTFGEGSPSEVGHVTAIRLETDDVHASLTRLAHTFRSKPLPLSAARRELLRRRGRSPVEVAAELSKVYGHQLGSVAYIPSLALIGRVRLGELMDDDSHLKDVLRIVNPYHTGKKSSLGKRTSGSTLSGHLVFGELADRTDDDRFVELAREAADLGFNDDCSLKPAMPFHNEMSDAVFMGTPILVQCGRLTGEQKYFDMAARHLRFMLKLNLRDDGLHQHSPLDPEHTAWGRGNGFPALGLALCLSDLPQDSRYRAEFLSAYQSHIAVMRSHQDATGMWHQIVDRPESYREFTVTCMTTFAITRGLRRGWLDRETYGPVVRRAWEAIKSRIGPDGRLVDVCTGTGKQKSRRDYYHRTAILGRDDRGGAMALMVSTELAVAEREGTIDLKQKP